jgi:hypothetical protein
MSLRIPLWVALSVGAAVFIGCGIFFAVQNLGTANDYATIASFFLALLTAIGSALSFLRSKKEESPPHSTGQAQEPSGGTVVNLGYIGSYQHGDGNYADVYIDASGQEHKRARKRRR